MLIDDARMRELLCRIAHRLSTDSAVREDLVQEAWVHLWRLEERRPSQRQSWYLQSCKFHLLNYLATGRSVDSPKRRSGRTDIDDEQDVGRGGDNGESDVFKQVSARDISALLSCRLTSFERSILTFLEEGMSAREIADRLEVTHPTVAKYRQRIASQALRLGIAPTPEYQRAEQRVTIDARSGDS